MKAKHPAEIAPSKARPESRRMAVRTGIRSGAAGVDVNPLYQGSGQDSDNPLFAL